MSEKPFWEGKTCTVENDSGTPRPKGARTMSYKARTFTREEFREVVAAAIYDYEHAPAKCLYTTKDAADQLYGEYGEETEVEE